MAIETNSTFILVVRKR